MKSILRKLNYALGGVVVAAALAVAAAAAWWVWRPAPQTSGTVQAPVKAEIRIRRDSLGVPHIEASSLDDALFAQGFVTAQDRFWQMDALRRLASGELSEVVGPAALELDTKSRRLRMRRIAAMWLRLMPAGQRAYLAAYARGVNHYLETYRGKYPPEFTALSYDPRPWTMTDTLLCALQMHRTLSGHWENDLLKEKLRAAGDAARVDYLFPVRIGDEPQPGSNAWVISGARSTTGKPILANDPHLEWTLPSTWYMVDLRAPDLHAAGASLPGVPAVVIGHNQRIAWGITALQFDNMDLYAENIDLRSGRYSFRGHELQAVREVEWIAVKGARPVELVNLVTVHGPVVSTEGGRALALKWSAASPEDGFEFPLIELNRAGDWQQFRAALAKLRGPNINVLYADVDGNIGWQVAGRLPLRRDFDGDVPLDGASGRQEWDGYIAFDQLPSYYNPPAGILASANQNSFPSRTPYRVSGFFASPHRARQIVARLQSKAKWSPAGILRLQSDVYSSFLHYIAMQAVRAVEKRQDRNPMAQEAARLLKSWNGQMEAARPEPFLATLLYQHLRRAITERAAPRETPELRTYMAPGVVEKLLRERPAGWFDDFDLVLANELSDALEEGKRIQGRNPEKWRYGRANQLTIAHPVAGRIPWLAPYFNIGPVPVSGAATTINAATERMGPSLRFVADAANWDSSFMNLTIGQSGHRFSGHYKDQWEAYAAGASFPLPFTAIPAGDTLVLRP
jgi:penicillin amidase